MTTLRKNKWATAALAVTLAFGAAPLIGPKPAHAGDDEIVRFPDANLLKALIGNGLDQNGDGQLSKAEMAAFGVNDAVGVPRNLALGNTGITNLSGIEYAVNAKSIGIGGNPISDLGPLAGMTQLEQLYFSSTQATDLSPLRNLTRVRVIDASRNGIRDISALANMKALSIVLIGKNQISDISALAGKQELVNFSAYENQIQNLGPLATSTWMREVDVSDNQISDLSPLASMTAMDRIYASGNNISSLAPVAGMKVLKELHVDGNQISDLSPIRQLTMLDAVSAGDNQIADISPLSGLPKLVNLDLFMNRISDVGPLASLTKLKSLDLGVNQISDIGPLANLTAMQSLSLAQNRIADITPLSRMTKLVELFLQKNQISNVAALTSLTELITLEITDNPLADATPIKQLPKLKYLKIDKQYDGSLQAEFEGVVEGGRYNKPVKIVYGKGQAKLDGKPIASGTVISEDGFYALELMEVAGFAQTIHFLIDTVAPIVTGVTEGGTYDDTVEILFNEGDAKLNGKPASSTYWVDQFDGTSHNKLVVNGEGEYTLEVVDVASNRTTVKFSIRASDAIVRGISNNGTYNSERTITFKDAKATLNGKPFNSGDKVSAAGVYTLVVTGNNGKSSTYRFTINAGSAEPENGADFKGMSAWAKDDIGYASDIGLTGPVASLDFASSITREKFSEIAVKLYESLTAASAGDYADKANPFSDTNNPEIVKAYYLGIVSGTSATRFSPNALITREQLAAMLKRVVDKAGVNIPYGTKKTFQDRKKFSAYAVDAIDYLSSIDVIKGLTATTFEAGKNANIEQALIMAKRIHALAAGGSGGSSPSGGSGAVTGSTGSQQDGAPFTDGSAFARYVTEASRKIGEYETATNYALKNVRSFTLPAYSAIYMLIPTDNGEQRLDGLNDVLLIANPTDRPKLVKAGSIDISLEGKFSDQWGTTIDPDGNEAIVRSYGPFVRQVVFDGPFDPEKQLHEYYREGKMLDPGSWYIVNQPK